MVAEKCSVLCCQSNDFENLALYIIQKCFFEFCRMVLKMREKIFWFAKRERIEYPTEDIRA